MRAPANPGLWLVIPVLLALLVHGGALSHGYLNFDDNVYFSENPHMRGGLTADNVRWSFAIHGPSMWIPLTWLSHQAMVQLFGLSDPMPHHALNVFLHMANVGLVLLLIETLFKRRPLAFWVACLYAVHPVHVESVSWLTERKDVLAGFFFWATLLAYARRPDRWWAWNLLGVLALMAKPSTVTLPCVLLLLDVLVIKRGILRGLVEKIPLGCAVAGSAWLTVLCQKSINAISDGNLVSNTTRFANVVEGYVTYLRKLLLPFDLSVPIPYRFEFEPLLVLLSVVVLLKISAWIYLRRDQGMGFAWLMFLGVLVPNIGIIQAGGQWIADRYMYLAGVAVYLLVLLALPLQRRLVQGVLLIAVAGFAVLGVRQTRVWHSSETLFRHAIQLQDQAALPHNNLGLFYKDQGDRERALFHYQQSLAANPVYPEALNNIAILHLEDGNPGLAGPLLEEALRLRPNDARSLHNVGRFVLETSAANALPYLQAAAEQDPSFTEAHYNLGYALLVLGQPENAVHAFERVLQLDPTRQDAAQNLKVARAGGIPNEARRLLAAALETRDAWNAYETGNRLREMGAAEAEAAYQHALHLRPDFPEALNNLGVWLAGRNRMEEALGLFQHAVALAPDYADAERNLAEARRLTESQ